MLRLQIMIWSTHLRRALSARYAEGEYTSGPRCGQECVAKFFKTGAVFADDYFTLDIKAIDKALDIVNRFNQFGIADKHIKINVAEVWK